ncbi:Calnexin like protein [Tritrichomonas foetus]|uniref:Calnexin like protein n=1 Tax=Tritrichomonas foetus TaxID=1144522 RepID=A0A1J4K6Z3_9EUKA|nr:Calnexin like protein [Tritrichomonas foetus]|eukprot:OHT06955.1 Calnexin like protein [Tritrichomonas foetus]
MLSFFLWYLCLKFRQKSLPSRPSGELVFFQSFNDDDWVDRWFVTNAKNYSGEWTVNTSIPPQGILGEKMLFMMSRKAFHGISSKIEAPFSNENKTLILQYEVRYQDNIECAGSYIKLFGKDFDSDQLTNETQFLLMFGPDHCANFDRVHFIINIRNLISGKFEQKTLKNPPKTKLDKLTNLYTLILRPDNSFEIRINDKKAFKGNLFKDMEPGIDPPLTIDDPTDSKPSNWNDIQFIDDPNSPKPEDWDENEPEFIPDSSKLEVPEGWYVNEKKYIPDPDAVKPKNWNEKKNGKWKQPQIPNPKCLAALGCGPYSPPLIKNPKYRGKYIPPKIPNPKYQGEWKARQIKNPFYYENKTPYKLEPIFSVGFELWTIHREIGFDNILISTNEKSIRKWNKKHFKVKHSLQEERIFGDIDNLPLKKRKVLGKGFLEGFKSFLQNSFDFYAEMVEQNSLFTFFLTSLVLSILCLIIYFVFFGHKSRKSKISAEKKKKIMKILLQREKERRKKLEIAKRKKDEEQNSTIIKNDLNNNLNNDVHKRNMTKQLNTEE